MATTRSFDGEIAATRITLTLAALATVAGVVVATAKWGGVLPVIVGGAALLLCTLLMRPDTGTYLFVALAYSNSIVHVGNTLGNPVAAASGFSILLVFPILYWVFVRRETVIIDYPFLLILGFGASVLLSTLVAKDVGIAREWIVTYVIEGVLMYFLLINAIRRTSTLRTVVWVLILVGVVLSSLSVYQEVTGSYESDFGGLAQRNTEHGYDDDGGGLLREREKVRVAHRSGGPVGGPNRYAQILLTILPLALFRFWGEPTRGKRVLAGLATTLVLSAIFLTYSRGGFLSLVGFVFLLILMRYIRLRTAIAGTAVVFLLLMVVAPGYIGRVESITGLDRFTSDVTMEKKQGDGAIRGRLTEMLAAGSVFLDHPIVGVGPGQFSPFYSLEYMSDPNIAFRKIDSTRRAHILYFELGAETGILGLGLFLAIAFYIMRRLLLLRARWRGQSVERAHLATSLLFAILLYLGTSFFLHLAYMRFYWLLLAVAGAAIRLLTADLAREQARIRDAFLESPESP
jgi:O-antigen ligase